MSDDWFDSLQVEAWTPAIGDRVQVWNPVPYSTGTVRSGIDTDRVRVQWDSGPETWALIPLLRPVTT
jgi:hypothetical protein